MAKKDLVKILHNSFFNAGTVYCAGKALAIVSNKYFDLNLDAYNSVEHLSIGIGLGTMGYRAAGGGLKGLVYASLFGMGFNAIWEPLEHYGEFFKETPINRITDIFMVQGGNLLGSGMENFRDKFKKTKPED